MRHFFLILMCLGVCLGAASAAPRFNTTKKAVAGKPVNTLLKKENPALKRLTSPVMTGEKIDVITPQRFFTEYNVTPGDNRLLKKAPRRENNADMLTPKIAFMERYAYDWETGDVERSKCYYDGGWDVNLEMVDDGVFYAYVYYEQIPVNIYVDYSTGAAEMGMEIVGAWNWADTVASGRMTTINDTTEYLFTMNEGCLLNNEELTNLTGTLYDDGTLWFPDGWLFCTVDYVTTTMTLNGRTTVSYDTIITGTDIFRDTYLMAPNATHSFSCDYQYTSGHTMTVNETCNAYMFQYDDSTVVAWNMWGLGGRGNFMYIYEDGTMVLPSRQVVGTREVADLEEVYPEYDWSEAYENILINYDLENDTYSYDDKVGAVAGNAVSWGASVLWNYCIYGGEYYALQSYPMYDNEMVLTDGSRFLLGKAENPQIVVTEGEECYTFAAVTSDGSTPYLFTMNPSTGGMESMLDNPYVVPRTTQDQEISLMAIADGYSIGKNMSERVTGTFVVPALSAPVVVGDMNRDGRVTLDDVTLLIDLMLQEDSHKIDANLADVDHNGRLNLDDVVALINLIISAK